MIKTTIYRFKTFDELTDSDKSRWYDKDVKKILGQEITEEFWNKVLNNGSAMLTQKDCITKCKYNLMYTTLEKLVKIKIK